MPEIENAPGSNPSPALRAWTLALAIVLPLLALIFLGQDRNWDLLNYHLYDPFAWLHGRLTLDIAPAQMQTWHNPLLDVPMYWMVSAHWPGFLVGLWLTLPTILALYLLLRMYALLCVRGATWAGLFALSLVAVTGAASFAVLGTTFNDAFVAAGVLGSLYVLLRGSDASDRIAADRLSTWCIAGVIAGATAGLKLTAAVYCLGLAGAAIAMPSWRRMPLRLSALLLGGIAGFVLTYGYWGQLLWHLHGNPFFPYYNQIFHSPDATFTAHADRRFQPENVGDALLVPIRLLHVTKRYSEIKLRDPRLLLGTVSFVVLLWRTHSASAAADDPHRTRLRVLAGFFLVSFAAWAMQSGIYRYVLPLEMLAGLALVLWLERLPARWYRTSVIVACLLVVAVTHRPSWGRSHFERTFANVTIPALPRDSMVVLSSTSPLAYAVTALPNDVPAIGIDSNLMHPDRCTGLQAVAEQRIASHTGPLWLLRGGSSEDNEGERIAARFYGLNAVGDCLPVASNLGDLKLCPLRRDPHPLLCLPSAATPGR
jgi:hypothetical protein